MLNWKAYTSGPAQGGKPEKIVLMLHGVGSNGQDLISLAPYFMKALPNAIFVSPDAPQPYDMAPMGRQWFSLKSFDYDFMLKGIKEATPVLNYYIDALLEQLGLEESDLALMGFSQGTMISLYAAPRRKKPIAGVLGYSGALMGENELSGPAIQKIPVCLVHGEADDVVPVSAYTTAKSMLKKHGFPVEGMSVPGLPHSIDDSGIKTGAAFLQRILGL